MSVNRQLAELYCRETQTSPERLAPLFHDAESRGLDLASLLVERGLLAPTEAARLRQAVGAAPASSAIRAPMSPSPTSGPISAAGSGVGSPSVSAPGVATGRADQTLLTPVSGAFPSGAFPSSPAQRPSGHPSSGSYGHSGSGLSHSQMGAGAGAGSPADASLDRFGRYEILGEISRGGMGVIHRARHSELGVEVALKIMLGGADDPAAVTRFEREAKVLAGLNHSNIVRLSDYGFEGGKPFFVMELVEGRDLKTIVSRRVENLGRPMSTAEALERLLPVAEALQFCHEQGIVHRDLKPHNVLVEEATERSVLVDFGLVRMEPQGAEAGPSDELTQQGEMVGTPSYMAPEQIDSDDFGAVGPAADAWGLGATLFFLLTGRPPYGGEGKGAMSVIKDVMTSDAPRARSVNPAVPYGVDALVASCLVHDQDRRPSMAELVEQIEELLEDPEGRVGRMRRRALAGGAALGLAAALGLVVQLLPGPPELRRIEWPGEPVMSAEATLRGAWQRALEFEVAVGEARFAAKSDADGAFEVKVPVQDGENRLRITTAGAEPVERTLVADLSAPKLRVEAVRAGDSEKPGGVDAEPVHQRIPVLVVKTGGVMRGQVTDATGVRLTVRGLPMSARRGGRVETLLELDEEGGFELPLPWLRARRRLTLVARDEAGRMTEQPVEVEEPAWHCLSSLARWDRAGRAERESAVARVLAWLGAGWRSEGLRECRCGAYRHEIATLVEERSGIPFQLIPGGPATLGLTRAAGDRLANAILTGLGAELEATPQLKDSPSWRATREGLERGFALSRPPKSLVFRPFLLGRYEVRGGEWKRIMGKPTGRQPLPLEPRREGAEALHDDWAELPAFGMNFADIEVFLTKLGKGLRLPSEAEWEYGCRGSSSDAFYWGPEWRGEYCDDFAERFDRANRLSAVALKRLRRAPNPLNYLPARPVELDARANAFGLAGMIGNVWERCADSWVKHYGEDFEPKDQRVRQRGNAIYRVKRGGGWIYSGPGHGYPEHRGFEAINVTSALGLRLARSIP